MEGNKNQTVVGNIVFNSKPEKIIPLSELSDEFKKLTNKIRLVNYTKMINDLKEFRDYYCKFRYEYRINGKSYAFGEVNSVSCPKCDYEFEQDSYSEESICDLCQLNNFINVFELEGNKLIDKQIKTKFYLEGI